MSVFVLVIDTNRKPLLPCKPGVARSLLNQGKAAVFRRFPFTIILNKAVENVVGECTLKIDPGSKTTGIAVLQEDKVVFGMEITHRGQTIKQKLDSRRASRCGRRSRNTRYRAARFLNRTKPKGWLAPSLQHRVLTTMTWVQRLIKFIPITAVVQELVRFDTQAIENPEINGIEYQQGELAGYECRGYLLEKWNRKCSYCGCKDVPLQVEHIRPKAKGGTNRVSNLCLACEPCNNKKGTQDVAVFLKKKPEVLKAILVQAKRPLKDAAAVNMTRWALFNTLSKTGLPVTVGTGGRTKWNRTRFGVAKAHWLDAACVGHMDSINVVIDKPLLVTCRGQGGRQKAMLDKYGYPQKYRPLKPIYGWRTGDIAKFEGIVYSVIPRTCGIFTLNGHGKPFSKSMKKLERVHRMDAYKYGEKTIKDRL